MHKYTASVYFYTISTEPFLTKSDDEKNSFIAFIM